ncbi:MAG TPA: hypothetical protein VF228_12415, partial [Iamia sp.]
PQAADQERRHVQALPGLQVLAQQDGDLRVEADRSGGGGGGGGGGGTTVPGTTDPTVTASTPATEPTPTDPTLPVDPTVPEGGGGDPGG